MVLAEVERVDAALSGVLPEASGIKTRSVMPGIIGLTPNMYDVCIHCSSMMFVFTVLL